MLKTSHVSYLQTCSPCDLRVGADTYNVQDSSPGSCVLMSHYASSNPIGWHLITILYHYITNHIQTVLGIIASMSFALGSGVDLAHAGASSLGCSIVKW
jgi:hypothetical protein